MTVGKQSHAVSTTCNLRVVYKELIKNTLGVKKVRGQSEATMVI